jgi:coenzyme F420-reducing hydrogenase beta subunit
MAQADELRLKQIALVGMSCQASINGTVQARGVNKYKRKIALTIGLLCSKTFTYDGQKQVLADREKVFIAVPRTCAKCASQFGAITLRLAPEPPLSGETPASA